MAILSNVNGKFAVDSTGAILFSTSHGTSGQILRSNGNAAPTWVAASTVIGGPYLPLTGGTLTGATATATGISFTVGGNLFVTGTSTLTGALSGSTGTFSSTLTVGGTAVFNGDMTLPAAADHFLIGAGSLQTTGRIKFGLPSWNNSIGLESYWMVMRSNSNEGYKFIDSGGNIYAQFNASTNSAGAYKTTFLGNLKLIAGASTTYFSEKGYLGDSFNFGTGETTDGVSYTINGAQAGTAGNYFRWLTQTGAATPTEKVRITDEGSLVVGNTPGTNANWGRIQCGGTVTVGNSSGTYNAHGRIYGDSTSGLRLIGTKSGTYTGTMGITIASYNVGINTIAPAAKLDVEVASNEHLLVSDSLSSVAIKATNDAAAAYVPMSINASTLAINTDSNGAISFGSGNSTFAGTLNAGATTITSTTNMLLTLNPTAGNYGGIIFKYGGVTKGTSIYNSGSMVYGGEVGTFTRLQSGGQYCFHADATNQNVHIGGTTDTTYKLQVTGTTYTSGNATFAGDITLTPGNSNKIILTPDVNSHYIRGNGYWIDVVGNLNEVFRVFGGTGGTSEYFRVAGDGNVGIGATSPSSKLHVQSAGSTDVVFKLDNTNVADLNLVEPLIGKYTVEHRMVI
jgi:hypothetical protein